jgi:hypothetical protein
MQNNLNNILFFHSPSSQWIVFTVGDFSLFLSMHLFYSIVMYLRVNIGIPVQAHTTGWFHSVEPSLLGNLEGSHPLPIRVELVPFVIGRAHGLRATGCLVPKRASRLSRSLFPSAIAFFQLKKSINMTIATTITITPISTTLSFQGSSGLPKWGLTSAKVASQPSGSAVVRLKVSPATLGLALVQFTCGSLFQHADPLLHEVNEHHSGKLPSPSPPSSAPSPPQPTIGPQIKTSLGFNKNLDQQ